MHIIAKNIEENVNASFIKSEISTETFKKMPCNSKSFSKITICFNRLRKYMYPFFEKHHLVKNNTMNGIIKKTGIFANPLEKATKLLQIFVINHVAYSWQFLSAQNMSNLQ